MAKGLVALLVAKSAHTPCLQPQRHVLPAHAGKQKQFKHSLGTRDPLLAKLRALDYLRAIAMYKPKLSDFDLSGKLSRYELDLSRGIARSDGPEDHARLLEAIEAVDPYLHSPQGVSH